MCGFRLFYLNYFGAVSPCDTDEGHRIGNGQIDLAAWLWFAPNKT